MVSYRYEPAVAGRGRADDSSVTSCATERRGGGVGHPLLLTLLSSYGSISGKNAVVVPVCDVTVSVTFVKFALTRTGTIRSGHVKPDTSTGSVDTVKEPRPWRVVSNSTVPVVVVKLRCRPLGC
jgi:hypothetical protein